MLRNLNASFRRMLIFGGAAVCLLSSLGDLQGAWEPSVIVSDPSMNASLQGGPVLRVDPQGNAISVWGNQSKGTMVSSYYTRGVGWQPPQTISSLALNSFGGSLYTSQADPSIALNSTGYAVAVWEAAYNEEPFFPNVVVAAVRDSSGVWNPVQNISDVTGVYDSNQANISLNEAGTALAAWRTYGIESGLKNTVVSFLPLGGSWTTPLYFPEENQAGRDIKPYPFINPNGDAVVVWTAEALDSTHNIKVATYDSGTGIWSGPVDLDTQLTEDFGLNPRTMMDANGNAVAIWIFDNQVKASYFNGTTWSSSVLLGFGSMGFQYGPTVVMDLAGNATAVWAGERLEVDVYSSSRLPNGTWTTPQIISQENPNFFTGFMSQEPLSVNEEGDVMAIWSNSDTREIFSAFKPFGFNWQAPEVVQAEGTDTVQTTNIGIASCGFAVALWHESENGLGVVRAAVNQIPISLIVEGSPRFTQCHLKFATQSRVISNLTWETLFPGCVAAFNIYCNGGLIETITDGSLAFTVSDCDNSCRFTVTAVDFQGLESAPVPFVF
ncbi:MAG TPA: hypothetical protein VGP47_10200 [Parachlamydiaceae bacterium]|nr:hypothetical protein [Parachlamydiaceae bacterium]